MSETLPSPVETPPDYASEDGDDETFDPDEDGWCENWLPPKYILVLGYDDSAEPITLESATLYGLYMQMVPSYGPERAKRAYEQMERRFAHWTGVALVHQSEFNDDGNFATQWGMRLHFPMDLLVPE